MGYYIKTDKTDKTNKTAKILYHYHNAQLIECWDAW